MTKKHFTLEEQAVADILANPIYAGIPPFPRIVSDDEWVKAAVVCIKEEGAEVFLKRMLMMLRLTYKWYLAES